jgi:hypothetical protein
MNTQVLIMCGWWSPAVKLPLATMVIFSSFVHLYLDQSVLENHHVASSFKIMQSSPEVNFLKKMGKADFKKSRKLMVDCVLGTDMVKHFSEMGKFKTRVTADDYDCSGKDKDLTIH